MLKWLTFRVAFIHMRKASSCNNRILKEKVLQKAVLQALKILNQVNVKTYAITQVNAAFQRRDL